MKNVAEIPIYFTESLPEFVQWYLEYPEDIPRFVSPDPAEVFVPVSPFICPNLIPNRYIVSNKGRVYDQFSGNFVAARSDKTKTAKGYLRLRLAIFTDPYHIGYMEEFVHRIVLMSFNYIPGCEKLVVDHKNPYDIFDNSLSNLQWATYKENAFFARHYNLFKNGVMGIENTLSYEQVISLCELRMTGLSNKQVAEHFKMDRNLVNDVLTFRAYSQWTKEYKGKFPLVKNDVSLTRDKVEEVCQFIIQNPLMTNAQIADILGLQSHRVVYNILNCIHYKDVTLKYKDQFDRVKQIRRGEVLP